VRKPDIVDTIDDLSPVERQEYTADLLDRVHTADESAPTVCHLDTGVRRTHLLLSGSLTSEDTHSVVDSTGIATDPHGTKMAGLALYGPLDELLTGTSVVTLTHRLESVKILPDPPGSNDPLAYGLITAQAAASVETAAPDRQRMFCLPVTSPPETGRGEPTLWSASIDALGVGTDIGQSSHGITLLGEPDPAAARLFVISAGNVTDMHSGGADATVSECKRLMSGVIRSAVKNRLIGTDPTVGVRIAKRRVRDTDEQVISREDVRQLLLPAVRPDRYRMLVATAAFTGMRWGETIGLCRDAVNLDDGVVSVIRTVTEVAGHMQFKPFPKSAAVGARSLSRTGWPTT
jgi:hypothetical protein